MDTNDLKYDFVQPNQALASFVENYWFLHNTTNNDKEVVILPDGNVDLFLSKSTLDPYHITLHGVGVKPEVTIIKPQTLIFAISFKLLAVEYILDNSVSEILNKVIQLPFNFWSFNKNDLNDFGAFTTKANYKIQEKLTIDIDKRKQNLFAIIYKSNGEVSIKELSEKIGWSSRQINRYFNQQFGISLKSYCNILRFRASFKHLKNGKLFPQQNFADQSHFIKEIKKLSGVSPKVLTQNQNDRFVQLSTLGKK